MMRPRSQALVATEPPAPRWPLPPAKASILRPRGKREPPRKAPRREARKTAGQVVVSDTRKDEGADRPARWRQFQYWGSTTTRKSGSGP